MTNAWNKRGDITTKPTDTERIIKECYEQLCANTFENWDEMCKFLKKRRLLMFSSEEIGAANIFIYIQNVKDTTKNLQELISEFSKITMYKRSKYNN